MTATFVAERGRDVFTGTTTLTRSVNVNGNVAVGDFLFVVISTPAGSGTNTSHTVTDSNGNSYDSHALGVQGPGNAQVSIATCKVTSALDTTDTITVTADFGSAVWLTVVLHFSGVSAYDVGLATNGGTGSALSVGPSAAAAQNDQVMVAGFGFTGTGVIISGITPSGFTAQPIATSTGTIRNLQVIWGIVSSDGSSGRSVSANMDSSHGWAGALAVANADLPQAMVFTKAVNIG